MAAGRQRRVRQGCVGAGRAYLDDLYLVVPKHRAAAAYHTVAETVRDLAGVQSHEGKLRAWCSGGGPAPADVAALTTEAMAARGEYVWTADLPAAQNGLMVLGSPIGTAEFVKAHGERRMTEETKLLDLLPQLPDTQCAWLLLLLSAVPRANHLLRTVPPPLLEDYTTNHDNALWATLNKLLGDPTEEETTDALSRALATLPARHGGLGLRSAARTRPAAYWGSWMDALPVLRKMQPRLTDSLLHRLEEPPELQPRALRQATAAQRLLTAQGYENLPSWREAARGLEAPQALDADSGEWRHGWQYHGSSVLERHTRNTVVLPTATPTRRALIRSQSGHAAGKWLTAMPTCPELTLTPLRMQILLRLRLHYRLPVGPKRCNGRSCRATLDPYGRHWSACSRSGRLKLRSKPLERAWARVFREAGARVQDNVLLRDTDLAGIAANDGRMLEIVATGLPLHRGVPLGVDSTMGAPLHANGLPHRNAADNDGVAIERLERKKRTTYPELVGSNRLRLTTLACETGGRWSKECTDTVRRLAKAKARHAREDQQAKLAAAYASRW